jgi:PP-loop superfamily ATP-utilizing enzyme
MSGLEKLAAEKEQKLVDWFSQFRNALVAYSGGVDSTYVLYAAHRVF